MDNEDFRLGYYKGLQESAQIVDSIADLINKPLKDSDRKDILKWLKKTAKDLRARSK